MKNQNCDISALMFIKIFKDSSYRFMLREKKDAVNCMRGNIKNVFTLI